VLSLSIFDKTEENISISWIYSRPAHGSSDALHRPGRTTGDAKETPEEFLKEVESLSSLPQPFSEVFDPAKLRKDRILHWLMRTAEIPSNELVNLAKQDVILLGDAAHAEPILGGEGANNAIMDAIELADAIAKGDDLGSWIESRAAEWAKGVDESRSRIAQMHGAKAANL